MSMSHKTCVCIRRLKMSPFAVVAKWFAPSHFIRPLIAMKELIGSTLYLHWSFYSHTKCLVSFFAMDFSIYFKIIIIIILIWCKYKYIYILYIVWCSFFLILFNCGWTPTFYFTSYSEVLNTHLIKSWEFVQKARSLTCVFSSASPPFQRRKKNNSVRSRNCLVARKYTSVCPDPQILLARMKERKTPCLLYNRFPDQKTHKKYPKEGKLWCCAWFQAGMLLSKIALSLSLSQFHHVPTTESNIDLGVLHSPIWLLAISPLTNTNQHRKCPKGTATKPKQKRRTETKYYYMPVQQRTSTAPKEGDQSTHPNREPPLKKKSLRFGSNWLTFFFKN